MNETPEKQTIKIKIDEAAAQINLELIKFKKTNEKFFRERFQNADVVFALPDYDNFRWNELLFNKGRDQSLESDFSELCQKLGISGISRTSTVPEYFFQKEIQSFHKSSQMKMLDFGWDEKHMNQVGIVNNTADDIRQRIQGAAGMIFCRNDFRSECDMIHSKWNQLTLRPDFPLMRSQKLSETVVGFERSKDDALDSFQVEFDRFCEKWLLQGLFDWHLPLPDGPHWADACLQTEHRSTTGELISIPPHFPIVTDEKKLLGNLIVESHRAKSRSRGYLDIKKWKSYAEILEINHLAEVARSRCHGDDSAKILKTNMNRLVAKHMDLSVRRVEKLQKCLREFREGKRSSLKDFR